MNIQTKLDQFRNDNPYDVETQAKRLLATEDGALILYVLALGLATAKSRQRHAERDYIKNVGAAPPKERLRPGPVTGSVISMPVKPSPRLRNAAKQLIMDVWRINGEQRLGDATSQDLSAASSRERKSSDGHQKNAVFYDTLRQRIDKEGQTVRTQFADNEVRSVIETVYGEFRKSEAA